MVLTCGWCCSAGFFRFSRWPNLKTDDPLPTSSWYATRTRTISTIILVILTVLVVLVVEEVPIIVLISTTTSISTSRTNSSNTVIVVVFYILRCQWWFCVYVLYSVESRKSIVGSNDFLSDRIESSKSIYHRLKPPHTIHTPIPTYIPYFLSPPCTINPPPLPLGWCQTLSSLLTNRHPLGTRT